MMNMSSSSGRDVSFFASLQFKLNIKREQQHVAVFHGVFLAFHPVETFFARGVRSCQNSFREPDFNHADYA